MSKHTPGPWSTSFEDYGDEIWFGGEGKGMHRIEFQTSRGLRTRCYLGGVTEEDFATARLIAAAPDLLAALKECLDKLEFHGYPEMRGIVFEAIAKAEGK